MSRTEYFWNNRPDAFAFRAKLSVDADGSPRAYHPDNIGLDHIDNAGYPGNWWGIVTHNLRNSGNPVVQGSNDPSPGYYVSQTALFDPSFDHRDPNRYVDAEKIPYIVLPPDDNGGARPGDFATVVNLRNRSVAHAIYADIGPASKHGEGSIRLAGKLGLSPDPRRGGTWRKDIVYLVYPHSGNRRPRSNQEIETEGSRLFDNWGGVERVLRMTDAEHIPILEASAIQEGLEATSDGGIEESVAFTAVVGDETFVVIEEYGENEGGQVLIQKKADGSSEILAADTIVFPLPQGIPEDAVLELNRQYYERRLAEWDSSIDVASEGLLRNIGRRLFGRGELPERQDDLSRTNNQLIYDAAIASVGVLESGSVPGTNGGRLACAWAVNKIVETALGYPAGGGLSTMNMDDALSERTGTQISEDQAEPGSIIMSPTEFTNGTRNTGHVGIVGRNGKVYSNSSRNAVWEQNYSLQGWHGYYGNGRKGLAVKFYNVK